MYDFDFESGVGLGAGPAGLARSTDGGATFTTVYPDSAAAVAFLSASVAVGIADGVFLRSTDGGLTWTPGQSAGGYTNLFPAGGDAVLAWRPSTFSGGTETTMRSVDGGLTWVETAPVADGGLFAMTLVAPGTVVVATPDGHMYRSTDSGASWTLTYTSPGPRPSFLSSAEPAFPSGPTRIE